MDREWWRDVIVSFCPTGDEEDSSKQKGFNNNILKLPNDSNLSVVDHQ